MSTESKKKKQKLPKWFNGELYPAGEVVRNPFSGQEYELTAEELSMYDLIIGLIQILHIYKKIWREDYLGLEVQTQKLIWYY